MAEDKKYFVGGSDIAYHARYRELASLKKVVSSGK